MRQRTLKGDITFSGTGIHTGIKGSIVIKPADPNKGIVFRNLDGDASVDIKADLRNVVATQRATDLGKGDEQIKTVEHILSSLHGLGVDNAVVEVKGGEVPILDGSAKDFVESIQRVGFVEQEFESDEYVVEQVQEFSPEDSDAVYTMIPADEFELTCFVDFESDNIPPQYAEYKASDSYAESIAPSRTFVFAEELVQLKEHNLIKGGSLSNALVMKKGAISPQVLDEIANQFNTQIVENGPVLNPEGLRFNNELARHKILDFIGDLALLGARIKGKILIKKPGHSSNIQFLKHIKKQVIQQKKLRGKPFYNPELEPVIDTMGVTKLLPHRYPFLLVDKIIELSDTKVVGVKNVTMNESFFQGHFPGNPVFPGVLQMEALAQTGGILVLNQVEDPENYDTYFLKLDGVKFKQLVRPGDTLILKMELLEPVRRGLVHMMGTVYVGNKIVSEGELTAQIINRKA